MAWTSHSPKHYLVLQLNSEGGAHFLAHLSHERKHVFSGSCAGIHKKIRVAIADARIAYVTAFESQFVDHASGGRTRRIFENAAGAFLTKRLTGTPLLVAD